VTGKIAKTEQEQPHNCTRTSPNVCKSDERVATFLTGHIGPMYESRQTSDPKFLGPKCFWSEVSWMRSVCLTTGSSSGIRGSGVKSARDARVTYVIVSGAAIGVVHRRLPRRHRSSAVAVLNDEINRHLALQTTDVAVTEVITQLVHLRPHHNDTTPNNHTCNKRSYVKKRKNVVTKKNKRL